jgi:hypothetical protein
MLGFDMSEADNKQLECTNFLEFLSSQFWCKQGDDVLVAVAKATAEVIEMLKDNELRVFPANMLAKMQKSTLHHFNQANDEGEPLPVVLAWKRAGVEIWFRRHNPSEFPYDAWSNQSLQSLERERVLVPADKFSPDYSKQHSEIAAKVKQCPAMIPQH